MHKFATIKFDIIIITIIIYKYYYCMAWYIICAFKQDYQCAMEMTDPTVSGPCAKQSRMLNFITYILCSLIINQNVISEKQYIRFFDHVEARCKVKNIHLRRQVPQDMRTIPSAPIEYKIVHHKHRNRALKQKKTQKEQQLCLCCIKYNVILNIISPQLTAGQATHLKRLLVGLIRAFLMIDILQAFQQIFKIISVIFHYRHALMTTLLG